MVDGDRETDSGSLVDRRPKMLGHQLRHNTLGDRGNRQMVERKVDLEDEDDNNGRTQGERDQYQAAQHRVPRVQDGDCADVEERCQDKHGEHRDGQ